ncbi:2-keto-4-pentenoate hydratase [Marinovum algicola]|uniref:2-keto-4-pentenoate hydratase n=1 Tax=Marinovum algicola TaxID=42444 RepID=A0A975WES7_9RHOB|nr:fumarylacetoacetate hydrolase family protein [Marinovum algicola]SEK08988.1 2-keto-4-pentenoate hydratase [Marinovum algicola]SLN71853.1 2-keto-4-pentenoate hydratase [Marinovum algicola]
MIASDLYEARETGGHFDQSRLATLTALDRAYDIQSAQIALHGADIAGWKIGVTSAEKLVSYGLNEPLIGPVYGSKCHGDGACVPLHMSHRPKLEAEIALRVGADIDAKMAAGGREAVRDAVEAALPAIEIVGSRYSKPQTSPFLIVADGGGNADVVFGRCAIPFAQLRGLGVELSVDGRKVAEGSVDALLWDDILDAVAWLTQHPRLRSRGLRAGDLVFTGACTALLPVEPGQTVTAGFCGLGSVTVSFCDAADL